MAKQPLIFWVLVTVAAAPMLLLLLIAWTDLTVTDADIAASAPEDLIGLGFWFTWLPVAIVQAFLFFFMVTLARSQRQRVAALVVLGSFVLASVLCYWSYLQLYPRVVG